MSKNLPVPTIEADGSIGEMPFQGDHGKRVKRQRVSGPSVDRTPTATIEYDDFELMGFGFALEGETRREAYVEIYVSTKFAENNDFRREIIYKRIQQVSPWLYTYGIRRVGNEQG